MALIILTKSPIFNWKEFFSKYKVFIKFVLGRKRGPDVVDDSLLKGLKELNFSYKHNVKDTEIRSDDTIYINRNIEALRWAIEAKKNGKVKKLVAGPNFVVLPHEHGGVVCDPFVDKIIVPASWVKDLWLSIKPELKDRLVIWPAGVDLYPVRDQIKDIVLVYQKNADPVLLQNVVGLLREKNILYEIVTYGSYEHEKYVSLLDRSKAVIFLSQSESQGIAMCEAWMKNVATLVWNRGFWEYGTHVWKDEKISAPYLTEQCGRFFKDFEDLKNIVDDFLTNVGVFSPRKYAESHFSNKVTAEKFLEIIK
jgi:hypothetical protein